jgi:hypothetical protein
MTTYWVTCGEYTAGPYATAERAEKIAADANRHAASGAPHACEHEHQVVAGDIKPEPPWKQSLEMYS